MKKLLLVIFLLIILILALPVVSWYMTTATSPTVSSQHQLENGDVRRLKQLIAANNDPQKNELTLTERDLNLLLQYAIQQHALPLTGEIQLFQQQSVVRASIDTQSVLRRFINIAIYFQIQSKAIHLTLGEVGSLTLPAESMQTLLTMATPYLRQHPQAEQVEALWQTIQRVTIDDQQATITFNSGPNAQSQLQQQQLQFLLGKNALQRLPFYQQALEQHYASQGNKRFSLSKAMQFLFATAVEQNHSDPISDNKAIILSLFLHTANHRTFGALELPSMIALPQQPLRFSLEGRGDLAHHLMATATITLFANSAIADTIGLYKELLDQEEARGFDIRDLIADRAGSLLASRLTSDEEEARYYQQRLAAMENESELFPPSRRLAADLELQLLNSSGTNDDQQLQKMNNQIDQHVKASPIYLGNRRG